MLLNETVNAHKQNTIVAQGEANIALLTAGTPRKRWVLVKTGMVCPGLTIDPRPYNITEHSK
jgi:hypothetical protein